MLKIASVWSLNYILAWFVFSFCLACFTVLFTRNDKSIFIPNTAQKHVDRLSVSCPILVFWSFLLIFLSVYMYLFLRASIGSPCHAYPCFFAIAVIFGNTFYSILSPSLHLTVSISVTFLVDLPHLRRISVMICNCSNKQFWNLDGIDPFC